MAVIPQRPTRPTPRPVRRARHPAAPAVAAVEALESIIPPIVQPRVNSLTLAQGDSETVPSSVETDYGAEWPEWASVDLNPTITEADHPPVEETEPENTFPVPTPWVFAAHIRHFRERHVRVLLKLWYIPVNKPRFSALAMDNGEVVVELPEQYLKPIVGPFVLVIGVVDTHMIVHARTHVEWGAQLDMPMWKEMIEQMHRHSDIFF